MGASLTEVLMGLGSCSIDFDYDPNLYDELVPGRHLLFYEGERLFASIVILTRDAKGSGIAVTGMAADYALGLDQEGPLVVDHEFVAGNDKLSDGTFTYGDLFFKLAQGSAWAIVEGSAALSASPAANDSLIPDDAFEVAPGQQHRATAVLTAGTLQQRLRIIYDGRFSPANLLGNPGFELGDGEAWGPAVDLAIVDDEPNARTGTHVLKAGPSDRPQVLLNPGFEDGAGHWSTTTTIPGDPVTEIVTDAPHARTGTKVLKAGPLAPPNLIDNGDFEAGPLSGWLVLSNTGQTPISEIANDPGNARNGDYVLKLLTTRKRALANGDFETGDLTGWDDVGTGLWSADAASRSGNYSVKALPPPGQAGLYGYVAPEEGSPPTHFTFVSAGEKWRMVAFIANDISGGPGTTDGHAQIEVHVVHGAAEDLLPSTQVEASDAFVWSGVSVDVEIGEDVVGVEGVLAVEFTAGAWYFDDVLLERIGGNEEVLTSSAISVVPGEEYELAVFARSDSAFVSGGLFPRVIVSGSGKPDLTVELSPISKTDGVWFTTSQRVKVDDGYDTAVVTLTARDIVGGPIWVDDVSFRRMTGNVDTVYSDPVGVLAGEEYEVTAYAKVGANVSEGSVIARVAVTGAGKPDVVTEIATFKKSEADWVGAAKTVKVDDGYDTITVFFEARDLYGDSIWVDDVSVVRVKGNIDEMGQGPLDVTPERTYAYLAWVRSETPTSAGTIKLAAIFQGTGRIDQRVESPPIEVTGNVWKLLRIDLKPPSGYDKVIPSIVSTDIVGGSFWLDDLDLRDQDTATLVDDLVVTTDGTHVLDSTAPAGAQKVRMELVAEEGSEDWSTTELHLQRIGVDPSTVADAVALLLTDLDTGNPQLVAGNIYGDDVIAYDWRVRKQHNYAALTHLLRGGVAAPIREWRVRPALTGDEGAPTIDVGTAEQIFAVASDDAGDPLLFTSDDVDVLSTPSRVEDVTNRPTQIMLLGADRTTASGDSVTISAIADVPGAAVVLDAFGQPIHRVRLIEDSSVNHPAYAQARVDFEAELIADAAQPTTLNLGSWRTKGAFAVGDWIDVYEPTAGLEDGSNGRTAPDGQPVFPARIRSLERTWKLGDGDFEVKVRRPGDTLYDIDHQAVRWEAKTSATVQVGKPRPAFSIDPQGGPAVKQFLRFRAQRAA